MPQNFTRITAEDVKYYLLVELFDQGKDGFDLTVCNGDHVWRETGKQSENMEPIIILMKDSSLFSHVSCLESGNIGNTLAVLVVNLLVPFVISSDNLIQVRSNQENDNKFN